VGQGDAVFSLADRFLLFHHPAAGLRAGLRGLIRDDLQNDTLSFLITRPVSRARLLIVKYIAQVLWLEGLLLAETLLLFAAGTMRQSRSWAGYCRYCVRAFPRGSRLERFGRPAGAAYTRYMATALIYGGVVEMELGASRPT